MMRRFIIRTALGLAVSVAIYLVIFAVVKKPVTLGHMERHFGAKLAHAGRIGAEPKVVVIAGSTGLYSLSCATIAERTGLACVNASLSAGLGVDYILATGRTFLRPGDVALLSLEYLFYSQDKGQVVYAEQGNNFIYQYDRARLFAFGPERALASAFSFDFKFLVSALVESAADMAVRGEKFINAVSELGDVTNHTRERGERYRGAIMAVAQVAPAPALDAGAPLFHSERVIADFIRWCGDNGVRVYGLLPTVFDDRPISAQAKGRIASLYLSNGAGFLDIGNDSQYGRDCFYDTPYHLNRECQLVHSEKVGAALAMAPIKGGAR